MSFGPCWFSSLRSATAHLQHVIAVKKAAVCPTSTVFFSTQEVSVGKAVVTEVQYQLEGHVALDEVGMSVGQPAAPPPSGGLLRLLWGLVSHSALQSLRWVIFFKTQCVCVYAFIASSPSLSTSLNPSR